jgi:hypothetical protein
LEVGKTFYGYALKKNGIDDFSSTNVSSKLSFKLLHFIFYVIDI